MMRFILFIISFITVWMKALRPNGARTLAAENMALREQLIQLSRHRKRSPKLNTVDRIIWGFLLAIIPEKRLARLAIIIKPRTLLTFHQALVKRKYRRLFSNKSPKKSGPKGPSQALIDAVIAMKQHNPTYGYRRIAMQITLAFGIEIDKDSVRRILNKSTDNKPKHTGPSWLTFIGHMKDSLWSVDLFRLESIHLKTHWVMLIMDQFTRRIIGLSVHQGDVTGVDLCCLFNRIMSKKALPHYLSSDNDPLFQFHRWKANLRILEIKEIKSVPYVPISHPFVERLIGTLRREFLDRLFFWNTQDLQNKLDLFQDYYNEYRGHCGIEGNTPQQKAGKNISNTLSLNDYRWKKYCHGLFQLPIAA